MTYKIQQCIDYIAQSQHSDGSFENVASPISGTSSSKRHKTTFFTSQIAMILGSLPIYSENPALIRCYTKAVGFLRGQISDEGTWNYWHKNSSEFEAVRIPDDLDDTFCAYRAIYQGDPRTMTGKTLATIMKLLNQNETIPGGPYFTWASNHAKPWEDVDPGVNANILYFLRLYNLESAGIARYLNAYIESNAVASVFYPPSTLLYFFARANVGDPKKLSQQIQIQYSQTSSIAEKILLAVAHQHTSVPMENPFYADLLDMPFEDALSPLGFSVDPAYNGIPHMASCAALNTALYLQFLTMTEFLSKQSEQLQNKIRKQNEMQKAVEQKITAYFRVDDAFSQRVKNFLKLCMDRSTDAQMYELPFLINEQIRSELTDKIDNERIPYIGFLNLCGWAAYRIYDDILDEKKRIEMLPIANTLLSTVLTGYSELLGQEVIREHMHSMERAIWNERNGQSALLYEKSAAHILCPLSVLAAHGFASNSPQGAQCREFFVQYLSARQLNDDAHDWYEDYARGQINSVCRKILKQHKNKSVPDEKLMREIFWNEVIDTVQTELFFHTQRARDVAAHMQWMKNSELFLSFLEPLEKATEKATFERSLMRDFLTHFD